MRKSSATGVLVVLKSAVSIFSRHSLAGSNSNVSTSPSALTGTKSTGSSKSNTNSVFGKRPRSDSKKNLKRKIDTMSKFVINLKMHACACSYFSVFYIRWEAKICESKETVKVFSHSLFIAM